MKRGGKQIKIDWLLKKVVAEERRASLDQSTAPQAQPRRANPSSSPISAAGTSPHAEQLAGHKPGSHVVSATPSGARHRRHVVEDDDSSDDAAEQQQGAQQQPSAGQHGPQRSTRTPQSHSTQVQQRSAAKQLSAQKRRRTVMMPALLEDIDAAADVASPSSGLPANGSKSDDDAPPSSRRKRPKPRGMRLTDSESPPPAAPGHNTQAAPAAAPAANLAAAGNCKVSGRLRQPQAKEDMDAVLKRLHDRQKSMLAPSVKRSTATAAGSTAGPSNSGHGDGACQDIDPSVEGNGSGSAGRDGTDGRASSKVPWWEEARQRQRQQKSGTSEDGQGAEDSAGKDPATMHSPRMERLQHKQPSPADHQPQQQDAAAPSSAGHSRDLEDSLSDDSYREQLWQHAAAASDSPSSSDEDLADFVVSDDDGGLGLSGGEGTRQLDEVMASTRARMAPESEAFELYLHHLVDTECCEPSTSGAGRRHSSSGRQRPRSRGHACDSSGRADDGDGSDDSTGSGSRGPRAPPAKPARLRQHGKPIQSSSGAAKDRQMGNAQHDSSGSDGNSSGGMPSGQSAGLAAAERIESKLCLMREMCVGSAAWRSADAQFVRALGERPVCERLELGRGAGLHTVRCQACGRDRHVTMRLVLKGDPTPPNWQFGARPSAIAAIGGTAAGASNATSSSRAAKQASPAPFEAPVGRQCAARVSLYHALLHFRTSLVAKIRRELRRGSRGAAANSADQAAARERVVDQQSEPLYRAYCLLLEAADQFVTLGSGGAGWANSSAYDLDAVDSVLARLV